MTENKAIGPLLLQITSKYQTYQNMLTISLLLTLGLSTYQGNRLSKKAYKILNSTTEIKQRCLKWRYWKTITVFELSKNNWGVETLGPSAVAVPLCASQCMRTERGRWNWDPWGSEGRLVREGWSKNWGVTPNPPTIQTLDYHHWSVTNKNYWQNGNKTHRFSNYIKCND